MCKPALVPLERTAPDLVTRLLVRLLCQAVSPRGWSIYISLLCLHLSNVGSGTEETLSEYQLAGWMSGWMDGQTDTQVDG